MAHPELVRLFNKYDYLTDGSAKSSVTTLTVGDRGMSSSLVVKLLCKELELMRGGAPIVPDAPVHVLEPAPTPTPTPAPEPDFPDLSERAYPKHVLEPVVVPEPVKAPVAPIGEPLRPFDHEFDILIADDVATRGYLKNLKVVLDPDNHPLGGMCADALREEDSLLNYRLVTFAIQAGAERAHQPGAETGGTFGRSMAGGQTYRGQPLHCWGVITIGDWHPILKGDMPGPFITGLLGHIGEASYPVHLHIMHDVLVADIAPHLPEVIEYRNKLKSAKAEAHNKLQMDIKARQMAATEPKGASKTDMEEFKEFQRWKAMVRAQEAQ